MDTNLYYCDIFNSISGEIGGFHQGEFVTFIRLHGCNLRCPYCDATHSLAASNRSCIDAGILAKQLHSHKANKLLITGGEPLLQQEALTAFLEASIFSSVTPEIQIETNGTILPTLDLFSLVNYWVFDYKFKQPNIFIAYEKQVHELMERVSSQIYLKFVVENFSQFSEALYIIQQLKEKYHDITYALSPIISESLSYSLFFSWMKKQEVDSDIIFNVQLHKLLDPSGTTIL